MATPYLDEAERCGRVALVDNGRLLALDSPDRLRASMSGALLEIVAAEPRRALERLRATRGDAVQLFGDRLHVRVDDPAAADAIRADLETAGLRVAALRRVTPALEDVFIERLAAARATGSEAGREAAHA
jgi:ABC-2 type transport system ATP-binding protein